MKVWDATTGEAILDLIGHNTQSVSVAFSPDGKRLALTGFDHTIRVWDATSGQEALVLRGHTGVVRCVVFSADGSRLLSASEDRTVKIWDARPVTSETRAERESLGLLDAHFAKPLRKADVMDFLHNAPTIGPRARPLALSLVDRYREETNPESYHRVSWALVRQPYLNAFQYRFALLQAEHAGRLADDEGRYRTLLDAAQYRVGRHQVALETSGRPLTT